MEKQAKTTGTSFAHRKVYKSVDVERGVEENEEEKMNSSLKTAA